MANRKIFFLLTILTALTSCGIISNSSSQSSNNSETNSETLPSEEPSAVDPSNSEVPPSSEELPPDPPLEGPAFGEATPANLSNFKTDIINDPKIRYKDSDYKVKPFPNGFSYPKGVWLEPTNAYLEFWHPQTSLDFIIVASTDIFLKIQEHGQNNNKDLYWPVTLQVKMNGKTFTYYEVGARMKGNTSRRNFVNHEGEFYDNINLKLSFNELWTEDYYKPFNLQKTWTEKNNPEYLIRDERTFMGRAKDNEKGMKKLDLKWNKSKDASLVVQPFAFSFFQKHGIISQNSTLTTLKYNNTKMGVVTINEPITKHLFRRYLPKTTTDGALYKVGWGKVHNDDRMGSLRIEDYDSDSASIGEENKFTNYTPIYDRKEGPTDDALLLNLMRVLKQNEGKTPAQYSSALEAVLDMDSFLVYAALSYLIGNPDDMRNNGNNYYIFFNPSENNKAYFIPYDYDWSLGVTYADMFGVSPLSSKHKGNGDSWQKNRLFWYTIIDERNDERDPKYDIKLNKDYQNEFIANVKSFNNDPMYSEAGYNAVYQMYKTTYNLKSASDLDNKDQTISPFLNTTQQVSFINDVKTQIANFP